MLGRKQKPKSNPINLVTPGDVVSTQQLLRVQQNSLTLFFSRAYYSYKCLLLLVTLLLTCSASCCWLGIADDSFPPQKEFAGLQFAACLLSVCELVGRLGLQSLCEFVREPLHWVDFAMLSLWYFSVFVSLATESEKYHHLVLAVQILFTGRTLILCVKLYRHIRSSSRYDSPNLNILNISQVPGEVEVIALDESGNNSQPSQLQNSSRNIVQDQKEVRVEKNFTYFSPKHVEAGQKLEVEE